MSTHTVPLLLCLALSPVLTLPGPFARAKVYTSGEAKRVASSEAKLARAGKEDAGLITTSTGARSFLGRLGQACKRFGKRTKPRLPTRLPRIIRTSVTLADT